MKEFLKKFNSQEDILNKYGLENFLILLKNGYFFRNDNKYRIEFWQISGDHSCYDTINPKAWIDYIALEESPDISFKCFYKKLQRIKEQVSDE